MFEHMLVAVRSVVLVMVVLLFAGCPAADSAQGPADEGSSAASAMTDEEKFAGNYELITWESFDESGEVVDEANHVGRIMYDGRGNMSAIGMPRDLPQQAEGAAPGEMPRAGFAYFSTYEVHPDEGYVIHNVVGSPMGATLTNTGLRRYYEFPDDDHLHLSLRNQEGRVTGTLVWRRLTAPATDQIR
ncbi:MAG: lipocalin-like domain-containing protein [Gemmatimonadota bacterium]